MLLDRRLLEVLAERLDIGRDVQRFDVSELPQPVALAPGEEPIDRMQVATRVFRLLMVAAKNSRKRLAAASPASAMIAGTTMPADAVATVSCLVCSGMGLV